MEFLFVQKLSTNCLNKLNINVVHGNPVYQYSTYTNTTLVLFKDMNAHVKACFMMCSLVLCSIYQVYEQANGVKYL